MRHHPLTTIMAMLTVGLVLLSGCEKNPQYWESGFKLEGEATYRRVADWRFTNAI